MRLGVRRFHARSGDESGFRRYNHASGGRSACRAIHAATSPRNLPPLDLSSVLPAFKEESRLAKTLHSIIDYLSARPACRAEIIVVDDGSSDRTAAVVSDFREKFPQLRLLSNSGNRGKGFSVRHGMHEARGEIALFSDADLSTPIEEADKLLAAIRDKGYDASIGSRAVDRSLIENPVFCPRTGGDIFQSHGAIDCGHSISDTQCGFKAFRSERARLIFRQQRIERFGFDPEILFLAQHHGLRVAEIPVRWSHDDATKVNVLSDGIRMFLELILIRWNALRGIYPRARKT